MKRFINFDIQISISEKDRVINGLTQTLEKLYKCRDLEISNLWQRSVFLAVFLTLTFTGYGILFKTLLEDCANTNLIHIGAMALSLIGLIFSIIWIMMGKGSKAWYEVYENAITEYEKKYWNELGFPARKDGLDTKYRMGMMCAKELNSTLTSVKGGAFSPSKLNIMIGQIFLIIWIIVFLVHTYFFIENNFPNNDHLISLLIALFGTFILVYFLSCCLCKKAKSGFLSDN